MFDSAILRYNSEFNNSLGGLLEALLYYNRIHVLFSDQEVGGIIQRIGIKNFEAIVNIPHLTVSIFPEFIGILSEANSGFSEHTGVIARIIAETDGKPIKIKTLALNNISDLSGEKKGRRLENLIFSKCRVSTYEKLLGVHSDTNEFMFETVKNKATLEPFINLVAKKNGATFNTKAFDELNTSVHLNEAKKIVTFNGELGPVFIGGNRDNTNWNNVLAEVHQYWIENFISTSVRCDVFSNNFYNQVANIHLNDAFKKSVVGQDSILQFQNYVFENGKYFAEAIDSGQLEISNAIKLIMKHSALREWVGSIPPGSDVMQEYCSKILEDETSGIKVGKAITKTLFAVGGAALQTDLILGTLSNLGLDSVQTFIMNNLLNSWSPSAFVKDLKRQID